jgi:epoxyqueuosine reductase
MHADELREAVCAYVASAPDNALKGEYAPGDGLEGAPIFETPLLAFGDAADPLFEQMRSPDVVGPRFMTPRSWMPEAQTVISLFCPFSEPIRHSNRTDDALPSAAWCIGRIEGNAFLASVARLTAATLERAGHRTCIPAQDPRFAAVEKPGTNPAFALHESFTSTWSERHVGYICGLGTFGLSAGLITEKGVSGRITSVVTDAHFPISPRPYTHHDEYCIRCGSCLRRCPADAISWESGKEHPPCADFLDETKRLYAPRFGCGKCQNGVPCEGGIPSQARGT